MAEAQWYVVHTYSGYENKVKVDLEKTIENRKLQDVIMEVSVPMIDSIEMKNGVRKKVQKKMLPGYVLVRMIMNDDTDLSRKMTSVENFMSRFGRSESDYARQHR